MDRKIEKSEGKEGYRSGRRGGRGRNAAPLNDDKKLKNELHESSDKSTDNVVGDDTQALKSFDNNKNPKDYNLKQEKGADLQQEAGADLTTKNRLKEKQGVGEAVSNLPTYGNYIRNRKKYNKHAAKVKQYAQPYKSTLEDEPDTPNKPEAEKSKENTTDENDTFDDGGSITLADVPEDEKQSSDSTGTLSEKTSKLVQQKESPSLQTDTPLLQSEKPKLKNEPKKPLITEGSRWKSGKEDSAVSEVGNPTKTSKLKTGTSKLSTDSQSDKPKLETKTSGKLAAHEQSKLLDDSTTSPLVLTADGDSPADSKKPDGKTQKDINRKRQYSEAHGDNNKEDKENKPSERSINISKSPKSIAYQHRLHDKADKLTEKGSKLREQQEELIDKMPTKTVTARGRVYDEETGKVVKIKEAEKRTLNQNETRWNNPTLTQKLKNAEGIKEKAKVIAADVGKKGAALGTAGAVGAVTGVGAAPAVAGAVVAKPVLTYGSKLIVDSAHRQVRRDIRQNGDNEVLKAAHWAEQKGERALGQGIRKLNPMAVRRYIKNAPYRRESKLQIKQLKNDKKLGLLRVKQDKATGVNHMTGKKSNVISRAWQKRQIKKNYQKAMLAAKGKSGGTLSAMARELARGNPKAIPIMLGKKIAFVAAKFVAKVTVLNPLFWKLMALVLMFLIILGSVQACVAIFSPALAGVGFVSDEDIEFSTRIYSEWETDLAIFVRDSNITDEFPPPEHITSQPTVNGVVVYPLYPYTPPPPFYEYRFEVGMIRHDPMELISYLTAVHGERFDEDSENPMTRSDLEAILREVFEAQYGVVPGEFDNLIHEETETRFRRERQTITENRIDDYGFPYVHEEIVYADIYYQFWILTVRLEPRSLSDVLRSRMTVYEQMHFDVLNITGNGRQVLGNPFDFNWLPFITSHYGYRIHPITGGKEFHWGIDIGRPTGTPIFATHTGVITQVQFSDTGYGNMLRLRGEGSDEVIYYTLFAHLDEILVTNGQEIEQGDLIATVGNTGASTGPHLHLEVIRPQQQVTVNGASITLSAMHLNPLFAVITWTDEESNEAFRPVPGEGGTSQARPPFIPEIPPEAMSDERFAAILAVGSRLLTLPYVWGAAGPNSFDCSGLIHYIFTNANIGWTHGRTTAQGYFNMSTPVTAANAQPGDLVFFTGTHSGAFITHVGIYVGNNNMLHIGGNPAGVEFVSLNNPFWQRHFHAFARP